MRIGAGPPESEYEIIWDGRTTREGELKKTIVVPQWAANQAALVFVVETDRLRLISEPFDLVPK